MIAKVILTNIKSHLSTEFNFGPGLTVLGGESDEGKSNVFRAIKWTLLNEPRGWNPKPWDSLKPKGKESISEVHFTDGNVVKRIRTFSGKNTYELNGEVLAGLHGKVPEQVEKVVNMNQINIQNQKDMFFLLDDTPGYVAKEINKVADLEKMDTALQNAKSFVADHKAQITTIKSDIKSKTTQITQFLWLDEAQPAFDKLEQRESTLVKAQRRVGTVEGLLQQYLQIEQQLSKCGSDEFFSDYQGLQNDMGLITKARKKWNRLKQELDTAHFTQQALQDTMADPEAAIGILKSFQKQVDGYSQDLLRVHRMRQVVADYKKIQGQLEVALPKDCTERLGRIVTELEETNKSRVQIAGIKSLVHDMSVANDHIRKCDAEIHSINDTLQTLRRKIVICPTCNRPVDV